MKKEKCHCEECHCEEENVNECCCEENQCENEKQHSIKEMKKQQSPLSDLNEWNMIV